VKTANRATMILGGISADLTHCNALQHTATHCDTLQHTHVQAAKTATRATVDLEVLSAVAAIKSQMSH